MDIERLIHEYKLKINEGLDSNTLIEELHGKSISIIEAIKIVRAVLGIPLSEAKQCVSAHRSWQDVAERSKPIQEEFYEGFALDE
jgi:ribosomal protein L7/L12